LPKIGKPGGPGGRFWVLDLKKKIYKYQVIVEIINIAMISVVVSPLYQSLRFVSETMLLLLLFVLCLRIGKGNTVVGDIKEITRQPMVVICKNDKYGFLRTVDENDTTTYTESTNKQGPVMY